MDPLFILRMFIKSSGLHKCLDMVGQTPFFLTAALLLFICGPVLCGMNSQHMTMVFWHPIQVLSKSKAKQTSRACPKKANCLQKMASK